MDQRQASRRCLSLAALLALGCASERPPSPSTPLSEPGATPRSSDAPTPWSTAFQREAVLAAARIEVVGPIGLLDHVAIRHDGENHEHFESATPDGLRIVERQRAESDGSPIRAQLDALVLLADVELVVLENPAQTQVRVEASGDVFLRYVDTGDERRARSLRLEGAP
ncbi:MAG: hypothetical protein FJ298_12865 [Planctomycetes bacterium]|nr:hypothetical protein [Planctomycetota bacterium]